MPFSVRFTDEGKKTLHELHIEIQRDIKNSLRELAKNLNLGKKLTGRLSDFCSLIVRKYRAIYSIEKEDIIFHYVGHRKNVYSEFEKISK